MDCDLHLGKALISITWVTLEEGHRAGLIRVGS